MVGLLEIPIIHSTLFIFCTPEEAAIRETQEEFGITPKDLIPLTSITGMPAQYCDSQVFLCR